MHTRKRRRSRLIVCTREQLLYTHNTCAQHTRTTHAHNTSHKKLGVHCVAMIRAPRSRSICRRRGSNPRARQASHQPIAAPARLERRSASLLCCSRLGLLGALSKSEATVAISALAPNILSLTGSNYVHTRQRFLHFTLSPSKWVVSECVGIVGSVGILMVWIFSITNTEDKLFVSFSAISLSTCPRIEGFICTRDPCRR